MISTMRPCTLSFWENVIIKFKDPGSINHYHAPMIMTLKHRFKTQCTVGRWNFLRLKKFHNWKDSHTCIKIPTFSWSESNSRPPLARVEAFRVTFEPWLKPQKRGQSVTSKKVPWNPRLTNFASTTNQFQRNESRKMYQVPDAIWLGVS